MLGHGLAAVRDQRLPAYAERFAAAGLAALIFDYRHFGASGGEPRQLLDIQRQLEDWRTALAYARGLRGVERVGLFGTSFGGGHVLEIAAEQPAVAAVVAQCPMTDGLRAALRTPPLTALRLAWAGLRDELGSRFGKRTRLIPAAGRPGELALVNAPDVMRGVEAITEPGSAWVNAVAARSGLWIPFYRPGRNAAQIECPLLLCVCDNDSLVSVKAAEQVAREAPRGEIVHYPIGHFDIYTGEWFERAVARQTEFFVRHLDSRA